jgi:hypothetical protein
MKRLTPDELLTANTYISLIERGASMKHAKDFLLANWEYIPSYLMQYLIELLDLTPGIVVHDRRIVVIARVIYRFLIHVKAVGV